MTVLSDWLDDWGKAPPAPAAKYANGGAVQGAGTGVSDSIPVESREPGGPGINYSDGEFVIPADVVRAVGRDHFDKLLEAFHVPVLGGSK